MAKVIVLMSTYNGEKHILEQIESIYRQQNVEVEIIIRDDGSSDKTTELIKYHYPEIQLIMGENCGYKKSFHELLKLAPDCDYFAFSDQDDFWLPNKLEKALEKLNELKDIPAFYCSNLWVVDETLNGKHLLHKEKENLKLSAEAALVENLSYGCTLVFNRELRNIALKKTPDHISHDGWINLIGLYFGRGVYDNESYILYRQHGGNVLGGDRSIAGVWKKRIKSFSKLKMHARDVEAAEFLDTYYDLFTDKQRNNIMKVAYYRQSLRNKIKLLFERQIKMSTFDRDFWYRIRIICSNI